MQRAFGSPVSTPGSFLIEVGFALIQRTTFALNKAKRPKRKSSSCLTKLPPSRKVCWPSARAGSSAIPATKTFTNLCRWLRRRYFVLTAGHSLDLLGQSAGHRPLAPLAGPSLLPTPEQYHPLLHSLHSRAVPADHAHCLLSHPEDACQPAGRRLPSLIRERPPPLLQPWLLPSLTPQCQCRASRWPPV